MTNTLQSRQSPLFFLHIPKTAGMAIAQTLQHGFYAGEALVLRDWDHVLQTLSAFDPGLRFLSGHVDLGIRSHLPPDTQFFTFLRDPVARCVSHVNYALRYHHCPAPPRAFSQLEAFEHAMEFLEAKEALENSQCKFLAARTELE